MKNEFEYWLSNIATKKNGEDYKPNSVKHYISGIEAIRKEFNVDFWSISDVHDILDEKFKLQCNNIFIKKDSVGKKMYSCALDRFIDFIYYKSNLEIDDEIKTIERNESLDLDEKESFIESLINVRNPQFQRNFRRELIHEFGSKCALCDINDKRLLIASHIIGYKECDNKPDMYKSHNGLLLCVDHDALFDKHLISFNPDGTMIISKSLDPRLYDLLNINGNYKLNEKYLYKERLTCLKSHLKRFSESENN